MSVATAFLRGYGPATPIYDVKTKFGPDEPPNYDGTFWGLTTARKALGEHFVLCRSDGRGRVARLSSVYDADPAAGGFMNGVIRTFCGQAWVQVAAHPANVRDYIHVMDLATGHLAYYSSREVSNKLYRLSQSIKRY